MFYVLCKLMRKEFMLTAVYMKTYAFEIDQKIPNWFNEKITVYVENSKCSQSVASFVSEKLKLL